MKITSIELTNFKAIGERIVVPVKPITLIFGANSAGKSSILQCLAMLAQSVAVGEGMNPSLLVNGPLVEAGNYINFIHHHDARKQFKFKFNFEMNGGDFINEFLPNHDGHLTDTTLNEYAQKLEKSLATFNESSLSFCFKYNELGKKIDLVSIDFFLGTNNKVFSYTPSNARFEANTGHVYWETYFNIFKKDMYNRLYRYPTQLMNYPVIHDNNGNEVRNLSEHEISQINAYLGVDHNINSLIEIFFLLFPDDSFYQQMSEEARQGRNEFELIMKMYPFNGSPDDNWTGIGSQFITKFSGFLPSEFSYMKPKDFLCENFAKANIYHAAEGSHPGILLVMIASHVKKLLNSFSYLGPLRKKPERNYPLEDASHGSMTGDGDDIAHYLEKNDDLVRRVNLELDHLQTGYQIEILRSVDFGVFRLQFINQKTGVEASIKDIGFGFSQILPVIVQSLAVAEKTVVIEQPELHLHPAMQAELGDMFIRGVFSLQTKKLFSFIPKAPGTPASIIDRTNDWKRYGSKRFFIETHSEHLILRLLRRIRENFEGDLPENVPNIKPNDIAVLHVQKGINSGVKLVHIPVSDEGEFSAPWPGGFFAERAKELF